MPQKIRQSTVIPAEGNKPKVIEEFIGRVNSDTAEVSIARMTSPSGWIEPGQCPAFNEYTVVLKGSLHIKTRAAEYDVHAGQAFIASAGQWIQYSTPDAAGAEYMAVCIPAFSPDVVQRE